MNDLARRICERLTALEVIEFYGFHPDRSGYIQCPFHTGDDHGSLKIYSGDKTGWYCFGCGTGGSVIDFVMRLYKINFRQACLRLNTDFHLGLTGEKAGPAECSALLKARCREVEQKAALAAEYRKRAEEYRRCFEAEKFFPPVLKPDGSIWLHPLYQEAVKAMPELEYWLDTHISF